MSKPIETTNQLTAFAVKVFRHAGYHCWRENTQGTWDGERGAYRKDPNAMKGKPDIIGFHRETGRFLACEIKKGRDRLSEHQVEFLAAVVKAGGVTVVVKTAADLDPWVPAEHRQGKGLL